MKYIKVRSDNSLDYLDFKSKRFLIRYRQQQQKKGFAHIDELPIVAGKFQDYLNLFFSFI